MIKACRKPYTWSIGLQYQIGTLEGFVFFFFCLWELYSIINKVKPRRKKNSCVTYLCHKNLFSMQKCLSPLYNPLELKKKKIGDRHVVLRIDLWILLYTYHSFFLTKKNLQNSNLKERYGCYWKNSFSCIFSQLKNLICVFEWKQTLNLDILCKPFIFLVSLRYTLKHQNIHDFVQYSTLLILSI